jgi:hypothetical protein
MQQIVKEYKEKQLNTLSQEVELLRHKLAYTDDLGHWQEKLYRDVMKEKQATIDRLRHELQQLA